jgi:hypothetical protein
LCSGPSRAKVVLLSAIGRGGVDVIEDAGAGPRGRSWPDLSAVLAVVLALPGVAGSLAVLTLIGKLAWPEYLWVVPLAWVVAGVITFVPAVEHLLVPPMFGVQQPTPRQRDRLAPSWRAVCAAAGVDSSRYRLLVRVLWLLAGALPAVARAFGAFGQPVAALLGLGILTALAFLDPWLLLAPLLGPVLAWSRRRGEYRADRMAAQLGYGPELIALLKEWIVLHRGDERRWRARLLSGHPADIDRVKRLKDFGVRA